MNKTMSKTKKHLQKQKNKNIIATKNKVTKTNKKDANFASFLLQ